MQLYQEIHPQFYPFSNRSEVRSCPKLKRLQLGFYPNFFSVVTISGALDEGADTFESNGTQILNLAPATSCINTFFTE